MTSTPAHPAPVPAAARPQLSGIQYLRAIAALTSAIGRLGARQIAMVGGLGAAIRPHLPHDLDAKLREPRFDPTDGAIILAGGKVSNSGLKGG